MATTRGARASRSISANAASSAASASWGWMPTDAHTSDSRPASAMAAADVSTSVPIVTRRTTPAARARSSTADRSSANSGKCR